MTNICESLCPTCGRNWSTAQPDETMAVREMSYRRVFADPIDLSTEGDDCGQS